MIRKSTRLFQAVKQTSTFRRSTVVNCAVKWKRGQEVLSLDTRLDTPDRRKECGPHSDSGRQEEGRQQGEGGRRLSSEILYGFSVLSLVGGLAVEDRDDSSADKVTSKLPRFGVSAAEPVGKERGEVRGGDGDKGGTRRERFNFIAEVVAETAPALVYIEIKDTAHRDFFTGQPITSSNGSGFIVKSDGLILTNAHVVINKPRASIQVRLQNGDVYSGTVEDVDVGSDLATVRIPCRNLPVMRLGASKDVKPGEFVVAMGSPLSLSNTITTGVVSNVARPPNELGLEGRDVPDYIQTDAAITFGNSGGPLINLDGEAIGINSMKVTPGISFAIPIDYAKEFLKKSEEAGRAGWPTGKRRYIGITMVTLSPQMLEELKYRTNIPSSVSHGILIYRLVIGSPADRAGLRPGDIVTHINGKPIYGSRDVYKVLESTASPLELTVCRDRNQSINIQVVPEENR